VISSGARLHFGGALDRKVTAAAESRASSAQAGTFGEMALHTADFRSAGSVPSK
jgi:hypothetical protein